MVDALASEIVRRIEVAIQIAEKRLLLWQDEWLGECYQTVVTNLTHIKADIHSGKMTVPGDGAGWGAGRALSEWGLHDEELSEAVRAAEGLYRDER